MQIFAMLKSIARIFAFLILLLFSCNPGTKNTAQLTNRSTLLPISYAKGFKVENFGNYIKLSISAPWQKSNGVSFDYYLVARNKDIPKELKEKQIIRTPVKRIICLSTSHIGFLSALNETTTLKGLSGAEFVSDIDVQKAVKDKLILDVGYDQGLNYETVLGLKPDLIMAYGVGGEVTGIVNKLNDLKLNVILNGEYLEGSPLAKAEWIKFVGALYEKGKEASAYFSGIEKKYLTIKNKVADAKFRPLVLTGLPFKDAWWMAGGNSNLARLISDAGGEFIWKDNQSKEAFVVSAEDVIIRAAKADYWIN